MRFSDFFVQSNISDLESGVSQPNVARLFEMQKELGLGDALIRSEFR